MLLEDYANSPDYMTAEELENHFIELIDLAEKASSVHDEEISEALYELSDRQWHTYEMLSDTLKEKIEDWINKAWNPKSPELIENITSIIGRLGLIKSFELVKKSINEDVSEEIKEILETTIKEINVNIDDPYYSMKKQ